MRISSKKVLAIVLSVAMLASCMVFSFSANAASQLKWKNYFNEQTDANWASAYYTDGTTTAYDNSNQSARQAYPVTTGGIDNSGAMSLKINNNAYATGFRLYADHDTTGNGGAEGGNAKGKFKPQGYPYVISFAYKLVDTSVKVDLYAAIAAYGWNNANVVNATSVKVATLEPDDARKGEWVYVSAQFMGHSTNGAHIYARSADGSAVTAEILIDNMEVIQHGSSDSSYTVTYVYDNTVVGTSAAGRALSYVETPALDMKIPAGYKPEFYSDAALENKLDVVRYGTANSIVYIKLAKTAIDPFYTEGYESHSSTSFSTLTDSGNSYAGMHKYSSGSAQLDGNGSGRIVSNKFASGEHGITQGFINAFADNLALTKLHSSANTYLAPKAGASYIVTFDVYADSAVSVAASLFDRSFGSWFSSGHDHEAQTVALTAGEWNTVTLTLDNVAANGHLVLGVGVVGYEYSNGIPNGYPPVIYIDNVAVTEYEPLTPAADPLVQDFESFANYVTMKNANHTGIGVAQINRTNKRSGVQSVWVQTANNSGAGRIQFNIPGVNSEYMTAKKGATYKVTFYVMPKETNPKTQMNFWLTAAPKDYGFQSGNDKETYKLYEASNVELILGMWNKITFTTTDPVNDVYDGGVMRLGICGPTAATHDFWIDDIKVEEYVEGNNAWSFETEAVGTDVDSKKASGKTSVTTDYAHTGDQSLYVYNGATDGRKRNQIYLKDGAGNNITVEAGKKYLVSFWAMATDESAKSVSLNMWFATGNGTAVRPHPSGSGDIDLFFDDVGTSVVGLTSLENKNTWVKVTRYLEVTSTAKGNQLLMGISDPTGSNAGGHWYMDDLLVVCLDDLAITEKDRTAYLYSGTSKKGATNLHSHTTNTEDDDIYTSIRLAAKYRSGDAKGSTYILNGVEYEIVERGIVAGKAGMSLDATGTKGTDYLWKSSVTADNGFATNWKSVGVDVADAEDLNEITFTLRLANMNADWFAESYTQKFQYRSYFVLKAPYYVKNSTSTSDVIFTEYGTTSGEFTFLEMADTFTKSYWFSDLAS